MMTGFGMGFGGFGFIFMALFWIVIIGGGSGCSATSSPRTVDRSHGRQTTNQR